MYLVYCYLIAIPSYYTNVQKRAILTSYNVSGICGILHLIYETTATALAYGIFKDI